MLVYEPGGGRGGHADRNSRRHTLMIESPKRRKKIGEFGFLRENYVFISFNFLCTWF